MPRSLYTRSSTFSNMVELEVVQLAGPNCWACGTEEPLFAPVIAPTDPQKELWEDCGLIKFSYSSPANSIPLCPTCHSEYRCPTDPCFVFFPTDLDFFIEYELRDRQRRQKGGLRQTPSASDYKDHQVRENKVSSLAPGGLYRCVFLKNYLLGGNLPMDIYQEITSDKPWHGDPIASFRQAIRVPGSARVGILGFDIVCRLHHLRDLYFSDSANPKLVLVNSRHSTSVKRPHDHLDNEDDRQNKRRGFLQDSARNYDGESNLPPFTDPSQKDPTRSPSDAPQSSDASQAGDWVLGPQSSTNEAIERFAPVLSIPGVTDLLSN